MVNGAGRLARLFLALLGSKQVSDVQLYMFREILNEKQFSS